MIGLGDTFFALEIDVLIQLGLAILLGGLVGLEREIRGRAAGLRTMIIVCLGSTLIMIVSSQLANPFQTLEARAIIRLDPGRVAAGIVTGVGFLGAGVVLKLGDLVRGVTTAACIWFVAGIGIALGHKQYVLAIVSCACCVAVLWGVNYLDRLLPSRVYRRIEISATSANGQQILAHAKTLFKTSSIQIMDVHARQDQNSGDTRLAFSIRTRQKLQSLDVVDRLCQLEGVHSVEWG